MPKTACLNGKTAKFFEYFGSVNAIAAWVTSHPLSRSTSVIASHTLWACFVCV